MKSYMKPTVSLAMIGSNSDALGSCIVKADLDLIQSIVGGADANKTFGQYEACEIQIPLEIYCKFTSAEMGFAQAFIS